jgi:hypothetical protein
VGKVVAWRVAFAVPIAFVITLALFTLGKLSPFDPVR